MLSEQNANIFRNNLAAEVAEGKGMLLLLYLKAPGFCLEASEGSLGLSTHSPLLCLL